MTRRRLLLWLLLAVGAAALLLASVRRTLPADTVTIGAGPEGGTYAQHARVYAAELERRGLKVRIEYLGDSLHIVERVNGPCPCLDVGFTAQAVQAQRVSEVVSAAAIELQPLFLFARKELGPVDSLQALAGRRLVMPLRQSASAEAARHLLGLYAVPVPEPRYLPIQEAAAALQRGEADAGFFMLAPSSPLIAQLAADPSLSLVSIDQHQGVAKQIEYLQPTLLPRGAFDLARDLPPRDVRLLAATVNVVVRKDIHPVLLYALLDTLHKVHRGQTLVSQPGEFPNMLRTALPVHEKAEAWAKSGTPWLYAKLPPLLASPLDEYWGMALFIVALSSVFGTLGTVWAFFERLWRMGHRGVRAGATWVQRRLQAKPALGAPGRALLALTRALLPD